TPPPFAAAHGWATVYWQSCIESAIDRKTCASDIGRLGASQIRHHRGDLLAGAIARQRHELFLEHLSELAFVRIHIRIDRAGLHIVDSNSTRTEVTCQSLHQALKS